jgi:AraC-like DNA-binding protein
MKPRSDSWRFRFWQLPELFNLEVFYGRSVTFEYPRHIHEDFSLGVILQGSDTTYRRGDSYTAYAGDLSLINAGEVHSSRSEAAEYRIFHISPESFEHLGEKIIGDRFRNPRFPKGPTRDPLLFRVLLDLHLGLEQRASILEQESSLISAIAFLLERQCRVPAFDHSTRRRSERIGLIEEYLRTRYADNVTLAELSNLADLSPYYLLRVFHQEVGCPPHEYQTQLRVAHAKKLIRNGHSIVDAAITTGFFDQSHFSRNFKRIAGVTPGQYLSESNIVQDSELMTPLR